MADPIINPAQSQSGGNTPPASTLPPSVQTPDDVVAHVLASEEYKSASPEQQKLINDTLREKYVTSRTSGGTTYKNVPTTIDSYKQPALKAPPAPGSDIRPTNETDVLNALGGGNLNENDLAAHPMKLGEILPQFGAMLATATAGPEGGFIRALARAFLGGAGGEAANQTVQAAAGTPEAPKSTSQAAERTIGSGVQQSGTEALGRVLMWPLVKILGGIKGNAPATSAEIADRKFDLGLTPGQQTRAVLPRSIERMAEHNVVGYSAAEPYREAITDRANLATKDLTTSAFGNSPVDMAGARVQSAITDMGSPAFKQRVGQLASILASGTQGKTIDWIPVKQEAAREIAEIKTLSNRPLSALAKSTGAVLQTTQPASGRLAILQDIVNMKDNPTFQDVQNIRSKWLGIGPQQTELLSNEAKGTAKHYVGLATEALDNSVANDPINKARWNAFRNFTRRGAEVMESSNITNLINADPEKVATSLGPEDITKARQIKRAVLGYTQNYGPTQDAAKAQAAWDKFRGAYIQKNLLSGDIATLSDRIAKSDPVIKTLFDDTKGQSTIANLKLIGDAMQKMDTVTERGVGTRWQVLKGIPAQWVVNMAYNPSATRFFVRGLNGLMQDSRYSAIQSIGGASAKATPYLGTAMADILRAFQMANTVQSAAPKSQSKPQTQSGSVQ